MENFHGARESWESWEEHCERKTREAQEKIRLYRGMVAIIPLLRAKPELGDISVVLNLMSLDNYENARKKLIYWLEETGGIESVEPVLRVFDIYSI